MSSTEDKFPILLLGTQMEVAGAQRVLLSQARWFHAQGYPVQAVFFYDKAGLAAQWQAENDFPVVSLEAWQPGGGVLANSLRLLRGLWRLFRRMRQAHARVIEAFTPHSNLLGLPVAWLARVPVRMATHHGYIEGSSPAMARLHGWLVNLGLATSLVAVSSQVSDYALEQEGVKPAKVAVVQNGIEAPAVEALSAAQRAALRAEISVPEDGLLLLTVGRFTEQKGHEVLLEAIAQLKSDPKALFAFAGDGPLRPQLEAQVQRLGLENRVRFLGVRQDVDELLLAADLFVQPSRWEGLSLALLEALWAGAPVLCTRVEGVADVLEDGHTACLVPPGDAAALAAALEELIADPALRQGLGQAGRQHVRQHYSIDTMCRHYEDLMRQELGQDKP